MTRIKTHTTTLISWQEGISKTPEETQEFINKLQEVVDDIARNDTEAKCTEILHTLASTKTHYYEQGPHPDASIATTKWIDSVNKRLPTKQELVSAYASGKLPFNDSWYWTSVISDSPGIKLQYCPHLHEERWSLKSTTGIYFLVDK
jgi:hypothetical protein